MTEDPERRIAALERGLSTPEPAPHPDAPRRGAGMVVGWIALGLLLAALVVGGGVILTGQSQRTVPGGPVAVEPPLPDIPTDTDMPPTAPGFPTVPPVPTVRPMPPPTPVPPPISALPTPGQPGTDGALSVSGIDRNETFDCEGRKVEVSGVDNTVVLTGRCTRVEVSGIGNSVRLDTSGEIVVSGLDNTVVYLSGDPKVDKSGMRNDVSRG